MTTLKVLASTALLLGAFTAPPVSAQEVIYNPGYCAQFYPNANCQNKGPGNPYTNGGYYQRGGWRDGYARMGHHDHRHMKHHRVHHRH